MTEENNYNEILDLLSDSSFKLDIELQNREIVSILELMLNLPIDVIVIQNIMHFLKVNQNEVIASNTMTHEELRLFRLFLNYYDKIKEGFKVYIDELRSEEGEGD